MSSMTKTSESLRSQMIIDGQNDGVLTESSDSTSTPNKDKDILSDEFKRFMVFEEQNEQQNTNGLAEWIRYVFEVLRVLQILIMGISVIALISAIIYCLIDKEGFRQDVKMEQPVRMISYLFNLVIDSHSFEIWIILFFFVNIWINVFGIIVIIGGHTCGQIVFTLVLSPFLLMPLGIPYFIITISLSIIMVLGWHRKTSSDHNLNQSVNQSFNKLYNRKHITTHN